VTSKTLACARSPRLVGLSATDTAAVSLASQTMTWAPSSANRALLAAPIPSPAPVTTLSWNRRCDTSAAGTVLMSWRSLM
jgi:hypothetical protein